MKTNQAWFCWTPNRDGGGYKLSGSNQKATEALAKQANRRGIGVIVENKDKTKQ